jgi:hypothetical protein
VHTILRYSKNSRSNEAGARQFIPEIVNNFFHKQNIYFLGKKLANSILLFRSSRFTGDRIDARLAKTVNESGGGWNEKRPG